MSRRRCEPVVRAAAIALAAALPLDADAQRVADIGFDSVGRGAPLTVALPAESWTDLADPEALPPASIEGFPETYWRVGPSAGVRPRSDSAPPDGIEPLAVD
ncbi:MAG: hypothetical protein R3305_11550, partial [Gammaproteobacteria bacterium]|nr:hypothetical protein [Gammaproteobacteria bacterium]